MPNDDAVTKTLNSAKQTLANANRFTQSVTGNSTNAFAPPRPKPISTGPKDHTQAPYSLAHEARKVIDSTKGSNEIEGINEKMRNVQEYKNSQ